MSASDSENEDKLMITGSDFSREERLQKSRERNREHARRTRMRKKARLNSLQTRVSELRDEGLALMSALQDCFTANLLLGLSMTVDPDSGDEQSLSSASSCDGEHDDGAAMSGKRSRVEMLSDDEQPRKSPRGADELDMDEMLSAETDAEEDLPPPRPMGLLPETMDERGLSAKEIDDRRRERNRQLARQTRGRKKMFVEALARTVARLEQRNARVRAKLVKLLQQAMLSRAAGGKPAASRDSAAAAAEVLVPSTASSAAAKQLIDMAVVPPHAGGAPPPRGASPPFGAPSPRGANPPFAPCDAGSVRVKCEEPRDALQLTMWTHPPHESPPLVAPEVPEMSTFVGVDCATPFESRQTLAGFPHAQSMIGPSIGVY